MSSSRKLLVYAVPMLVTAVDVCVLLHHLVGLQYVIRIRLEVRDDVLGEDGRDDEPDITLQVINVICPPLAST